MDTSRWPVKASFPIAVPGMKLIGSAAVVTVVLLWLGWWIFAGMVFLFLLFSCWFFRDPERRIPPGDEAIVSPADGRIVTVDTRTSSLLDGERCIRISIFMNVFNVHVNRVPLGGTVEQVQYFPGRFINASLDKASEHNERNALVLRHGSGRRYAVVQIAGLIARRIVCPVTVGDRLERGGRYGMICFGSRLDLDLPPDTRVTVRTGEKVTAGETVLGHLATLVS